MSSVVVPESPVLVEKKKLGLFPAIFNGALAGVVGTAIIFPLDFSKTYLQTQTNISSGALSTMPKYKNIFDVMIGEAKIHGVRRLYNGLQVNLFLVMPEKAIKLSVNEVARRHFGAERGQILPYGKELICGALAGFCQVFATTPMEFLKIQYQMGVKMGNKGVYFLPGLRFHILRSFVCNGITSFYRGFVITMYRDVIFSSLYFPIFATLNRRTSSKEKGALASFSQIFASAIIAGLIATVSVTPLDVVKTRLQLLDPMTELPRYSSIYDCVFRTYQYDGLNAFFKGTTARVMVIPILFGIAQAVYFMGIGEKLAKKISEIEIHSYL